MEDETELKRLTDQNVGLKRRIELLETQNKRYRDAIEFTVRTLDLCRDDKANVLEKMVDKGIAEDMLRKALE